MDSTLAYESLQKYSPLHNPSPALYSQNEYVNQMNINQEPCLLGYENILGSDEHFEASSFEENNSVKIGPIHYEGSGSGHSRYSANITGPINHKTPMQWSSDFGTSSNSNNNNNNNNDDDCLMERNETNSWLPLSPSFLHLSSPNLIGETKHKLSALNSTMHDNQIEANSITLNNDDPNMPHLYDSVFILPAFNHPMCYFPNSNEFTPNHTFLRPQIYPYTYFGCFFFCFVLNKVWCLMCLEKWNTATWRLDTWVVAVHMINPLNIMKIWI
ncbi:hypothetical protein RFI_26862 [Reticulomyxa filosa]|uniref:Uncharacterized protein n=1 Tax=Reticulomyxa filosa TaxID=46433 RepID=X6M938_RETFI|nr:hypothetical protein RFI_26862 [Reticulomyxa filosa]|eukprot:ETO10518.1 hypothetical protein RFI_26862 [Reticulomyxa filosa]